MIVLGVILLVLGWLTGISLLYTLGVILLVIVGEFNSGKSALIDHTGEFASAIGGSGVQAVIRGEVVPRPASLYSRFGDVLMIGAAAAAVAVWWRGRTVVVSDRPAREEE